MSSYSTLCLASLYHHRGRLYQSGGDLIDVRYDKYKKAPTAVPGLWGTSQERPLLTNKKFSRIPLPAEFTDVPREAIATYTVLASYANNKTGLCWPKMETLAKTLGCSVRTVQRHLTALSEAGMVRFVDRRRVRGRFSSYTYQLVHFLKYATTGHRRPPVKRSLYKNERKRISNKEKKSKTREEEAKRRREGFEWLFE